MRMLSTLLLMLLAVSCLGNIGDTKEQLEARYGKPGNNITGDDSEDKNVTHATYWYKDYQITVVLLKAKSAVEVLSHSDSKIKMPDIECLGLMQAVTGVTNWVAAQIKDTGPNQYKFWSAGWFYAIRSDFESGINRQTKLRIEGRAWGIYRKEQKDAQAVAEKAKKQAEIDAVANSFKSGPTNAAH